MGLESFFIKVVPESEESLEYDSMNDMFKALKMYQNHHGDYIFKDSILIEFVKNANQIDEVILQGCFSRYEENLHDMFVIAEQINKLARVRIWHALGVDMPVSDEKDCIQAIKRIYHNKHSKFLTTFGDVRFVSLPDNEFYKKFRRYKIKAFWRNLFKRKS